MSVHRPNWEAITSVEPNRESILRTILFATERECTPEELLETRATTGYLKMARRMVDQFVQGATRFIIQTDFDADGITSGVIWERHLKRIAPVSVRIPTRAQGHPSLEPMINEMRQNPASHLVILDNGANSWPRLSPHLQNEKVLIVDHHEPEPLEIPLDDRIAVINPHILPGKKNENDLSTAGLSYYLLPESDPKAMILAGIGQLGDVMPLTPLSHQIARQTLARLHDQQPPSLLPLLPKDLTVQGLSFFTIPKINAVSRMSHPMLMYCILSSDEPAPATFEEILRQNQQRQDVTAVYLEKARLQVTADAVQVIYIPDMPASIAGLIASRLSEELFKPVLCVCNQEILSGSFRSPIDLNLALLIMQLRSEGVLLSGGGHKKAAGLSLRASQLPELRKRLQTIAVIVSRKYIPMPAMPFDELASYYSELEPYGAGSRAPFWGIPFYRSNVLPLYTRETKRHWANRGELHTPAGIIPFLECLTASWKPCGIAIGKIDWDAYKQRHILRIEDIL